MNPYFTIIFSLLFLFSFILSLSLALSIAGVIEIDSPIFKLNKKD
jgi:hypothetical protein